jgi:putative ABC transport system permease protein
LLSLLGGALGVIFGAWSVQALVALGEGTIPRANSIALDWRVLLFAFAVSLFTGVLFGTIPALRGAGFDFQQAMKDSGYSTSEGQRRRSVRNGLIVGEVAIAAVLLVASILVIKSLWKLTHVDPGFEANNVLTISIRTPQEHQRDRKESVAYRTELLRLVSEVPGVVAVGASKTLPMEAGGEPYSFTYTGGSGVVDIKPDAGVFIVSPDYFKALQIPLIAGRTFTQEDNVVGAPGVLIVNQALANRYWPGESAIGKELRVDKTVIPIVGVVGDVRSEGLAKTPRSAIYGPFGKFPRSALQIYVRTNGNPLSVAGPVREAIWSYEKNQPMEISTLSSISERQVAQPKFFTTLLSGFGGLALLLAAIGIYGVISYNVTRQIREIGIRMALGAQPSQVLSMVLRDALRLTAMGLAIGLLLALLATRALGSLLFGVSANDLASYAVMPLLLTGIALLASYVPARRATKVDPIVALHYE